jgi:hypothetical protein
MSDNTRFALLITTEIAPDEIDLAPSFYQAFLRGGRARKELFIRSGGEPGAFSPDGLVLVIPAILSAISLAGPLLLQLLTDSILSNIKTMLEVLDHAKPKKDPAMAPTPPSIAVDSEILRRVAEAMGQDLRRHGIVGDQADAMTYRVLKVLMQHPEDAQGFVQTVASARS